MAESPGLLLLNAEDNDLSHLAVTEEGSNTFTIDAGAAAHGSLGYLLTFSGNAGVNLLYAYETFTAGADIYCRCYFYIPASFNMSASQFRVLGMRSSLTQDTIYVRMVISGGVISFDRMYYQISTGQAFAAFTGAVSRDTWHSIELRYKADASAGIVEGWFDETLKAQVTGLNTGGFNCDRVLIGNILGAVPTAGSVIYIDDAKTDSAPIGAYADVSGVNISGNYYRGQMQ